MAGGRISDALAKHPNPIDSLAQAQHLTDTQFLRLIAGGKNVGVDGVDDAITAVVYVANNKQSLRLLSLAISGKLKEGGTTTDVIVGLPSDDPANCNNLKYITKAQTSGYVIALVKTDYLGLDTFVTGDTITHAKATSDYAFLIPFWDKDNVDMVLVAVRKLLPIPQGYRPPSGRQFDTNQGILDDIGSPYASWMSILFEQYDPQLMKLLMDAGNQTLLGNAMPTLGRGRSLVEDHTTEVHDADAAVDESLANTIAKVERVATQVSAIVAKQAPPDPLSLCRIPRNVGTAKEDDELTVGTTSVSPDAKAGESQLRSIRLRLLGLSKDSDGVLYLPKLKPDMEASIYFGSAILLRILHSFLTMTSHTLSPTVFCLRLSVLKVQKRPGLRCLRTHIITISTTA